MTKNKSENKSIKGAKNILKEFKEFALRGNMLDMAVGIVIGSAFTAMVTSIVSDTIIPAIFYFIGKANYETLKWQGILYGKTISTIVNFFIVAAVVFIMVKAINTISRMRKSAQDEEAEAKEEIKEEVKLLREIRDLLKSDKEDRLSE